MVETAAEGVLYDNHAQAYPESIPCPLLEYGSTQSRQIMLQTPMGLEGRPEDIWHSKDDANERYIGQFDPPLPLPE